MRIKLFMFLCAVCAFSVLSAWVVYPIAGKYEKEKEAYKQIIWQELGEKYEIDMGESSVGTITYAVKDERGNFTTWQLPTNEFCVYIYGDCLFDGKISPYFGVYSLSLQKVLSCGIK